MILMELIPALYKGGNTCISIKDEFYGFADSVPYRLLNREVYSISPHGERGEFDGCLDIVLVKEE